MPHITPAGPDPQRRSELGGVGAWLRGGGRPQCRAAPSAPRPRGGPGAVQCCSAGHCGGSSGAAGRGEQRSAGGNGPNPPQPRPHRAAPHAVPVPGCPALTVAPRTRAVPARGGGGEGGGATAGELRCCRCCRCGSAQGAAPGARPGPARLPALRRAAGCQGHRYRHRHPRYRQAGGETAGRPLAGGGRSSAGRFPPSQSVLYNKSSTGGGGLGWGPSDRPGRERAPAGYPYTCAHPYVSAQLYTRVHSPAHTYAHLSAPRASLLRAEPPLPATSPAPRARQGQHGPGGAGGQGAGIGTAARGTQRTHIAVTKPDPNSFIL